MATVKKLPSGTWRAQVRRKGQYASKTFRLKEDAEAWGIEAERAIQIGKKPNGPSIDPKTTFGYFIDLHIADTLEVGRPLLRSKSKCLEKLKADLGRERLGEIDRECLIAFGKARAKKGAGPVTVSMDLGYMC